MEITLQWAIGKIMDLVSPDYYGTVKLTFHGGKISQITSEQSFKPEIDLKSPVK